MVACVKQLVCLLLCPFLNGCGLFSPELVSEGVYPLDTAAVSGCRPTATAVARDGGLLVAGRLTGAGFLQPETAAIEVALVSRDGSELDTKYSSLRHNRTRRANRAHVYFDAKFDKLPPPGTSIRIRARAANSLIPGCGKPAGDRWSGVEAALRSIRFIHPGKEVDDGEQADHAEHHGDHSPE